MNKRFKAIALLPIVCAFVTAAPAIAASATVGGQYREPEPERTQQVEPWPDEGRGYPGYTDPAPQAAPASSDSQANELQTTSVAVGALGGIALGGAALGITLVVQRRRDRISAENA